MVDANARWRCRGPIDGDAPGAPCGPVARGAKRPASEQCLHIGIRDAPNILHRPSYEFLGLSPLLSYVVIHGQQSEEPQSQ